jgi:hypothetical protein
VFLLAAARAPDKLRPDIESMTWLGKNVLVCAGPTQDLVCLKTDTGEPEWRLERVWEYERGFIGPSVWQHTIGRAGADDEEEQAKDEGKKEGKKVGKAAGRAGRQYAIVGGPVVVDSPKPGRTGSRSVFVAVAKGPARYAEYLSECVVYELDSSGTPVGMVTLPRMVRGGQRRVHAGGLVWACQGGGFVRLLPTPSRELEVAMGPGGPDKVCHVDWYRHLSRAEPEAWLISDPAGDPVAFGDDYAVRVSAGGYVPDADAGVYHFPISMVDLKSGVSRDLELKVPFTGQLPLPQTNFSRTTRAGGKDQWHPFGPYVLAVTGLRVDGTRLRITIGMENWARDLEFDLREPPAGAAK